MATHVLFHVMKVQLNLKLPLVKKYSEHALGIWNLAFHGHTDSA